MDNLKPCPLCGGEAATMLGHIGPSCVGCPECLVIIEFDDGGMDAAIEAWNIRPSPWVDVNERLPSRGVRVICCMSNGTTQGILFDGDVWWLYGRDNLEKPQYPVTHWMPMPEKKDG